MLIGNGRLTDKVPMSFLGRDWNAQLQPGGQVGSTWAANLTAYNALPTGYYQPHGWMLPRKAGYIKATLISGSGGASATAQSARSMQATLSGSGDISSATMGLIVSIAATLSGSGGISSATAQALAALAATLAGSGGITATASGLAELSATLTGQGTMTLNNTALADLAVTMVGYGELTPQGIRDAVWNAILESGYSSSDILRLIAAATQGSATGLESGSPVFKSMDGTVDRITATYASGTRVVTARDAE